MGPLTPDARLLFTTRVVRLFGYGLISVILVLYLASAGIDAGAIGLILTFTLLGDTAVSLAITTRADRIGRKRMLLLGAALVAAAGFVFASTRNFALLVVAAILGVISPSGNEVGPFLAIEQAALTQVVGDERRTTVFAWYALAGSLATAVGSFAGGALAELLQRAGWPELASYRVVVVAYGVVGIVLAALVVRLSPAIEAHGSVSGADERRVVAGAAGSWTGLGRSRGVVLRLSALFGLDAFAGGFIVQSILAYWFHIRFGMNAAMLGSLFFGLNLLGGLSALAAARIAQRIGLVRTMVFTHLPSNVLLMFVPLMPNATSAVLLMLVRYSISQMDVPTRQSYTMAVVAPEERSAAAGFTGVTRTIGAAMAPVLATTCVANAALMNVPFYVAGGLKIAYDLLLYRSFASLRAPEEQPPDRGSGDTQRVSR